jgi:hypothetical protein
LAFALLGHVRRLAVERASLSSSAANLAFAFSHSGVMLKSSRRGTGLAGALNRHESGDEVRMDRLIVAVIRRPDLRDQDVGLAPGRMGAGSFFARAPAMDPLSTNSNANTRLAENIWRSLGEFIPS